MGRAIAIVLVVAACGSSSHPGSGGGGGGGGGGPDGGTLTLLDRQRQLALDLRGVGNYMSGVGNDNSGPYTHGVPMDLHYAYLTGYGDEGGWPTWNAGGDYP